MQNHYFDDTDPLTPYTHSAAANPGTLPPKNAMRGEKPEIKEGYWPCWNGKSWKQVVDFRGVTYWMRDKEGQIIGTTISQLDENPPAGSYENQEDVPPTPEEVAEQRLAEIDSELAAIDAECIRPLRAIAAGVATEFDHDKLMKLDDRADDLRAERAQLMPTA